MPELGEGGACSLFGQLAEQPYGLAGILGGQGADNRRLLAEATIVTRYYREHSRSHWFGVYQARRKSADESVLVKLAYFGAESRAEFPLTEAFAAGSNNSAVGLSGRARLINDVAAFVAEGGGYYTCDPKVKAEACLPLFDADRRVVGILDSEAFDKDFFGGDEPGAGDRRGDHAVRWPDRATAVRRGGPEAEHRLGTRSCRRRLTPR